MNYAALNVLSGPLKGQSLPLVKREMLLGRGDDCDLKLVGYEGVSRHHVRLTWDGKKFLLQDLASTNGVLVDGNLLPPTQSPAGGLVSGSSLQLGDFSAQLWLPPGKPAFEGDAPSRTPFAKWSALPTASRALAGLGIVLVLGLGTWGWLAQPDRDPIAVALEGDASKGPQVKTPPVADGAVAAPIDSVNGKISPAAIANVKAATVMIAQRTRSGWGFGSGFVVGETRRVVTNRHVVVDDNERVQDCILIFHCGTPQETKVSISASNITLASRSRGNEDFTDDLAVIALPAPVVPALSLGRAEELTEVDTVYAIGFPLGVGMLTLDDKLPSVSIKAVNVERLQQGKIEEQNAVTVMQLGGTVTEGNSGGPVVNNKGEVVGVISRGISGTGISYAIPSGFVKSLR